MRNSICWRGLCIKMNGIVFDIQRAALHDGPGLRTTVFLKGCHLRCAWCHNPESQKLVPETGKNGKVYGRTMTIEEVMSVVQADRCFYETSGGGLTLSGGEPTVQFDFCIPLLQAAKAAGIHTCLDTCGNFPSACLPVLFPLVDLWHFDYKATGPEEHTRWTGVDGQLIQQNLAALREMGAAIILRCPIIPGANDSAEHLARIDDLKASGDLLAVERLPFHTTGNSKYTDLGRPVPSFS
ncbi:MAG: radical SAM protein [Opitutae bacterium]